MTVFQPKNYSVTKLRNKNTPLILKISYKSVGKSKNQKFWHLHVNSSISGIKAISFI